MIEDDAHRYKCVRPPVCDRVEETTGDVYPDTSEGKENCERHCVSKLEAVWAVLGGALGVLVLAALLAYLLRAPSGAGVDGAAAAVFNAMSALSVNAVTKTQDALRR